MNKINLSYNMVISDEVQNTLTIQETLTKPKKLTEYVMKTNLTIELESPTKTKLKPCTFGDFRKILDVKIRNIIANAYPYVLLNRIMANISS